MNYTAIPVLPWREYRKPRKCLVRTYTVLEKPWNTQPLYNTGIICQTNHFLMTPMINKIHTAISLILSTLCKHKSVSSYSRRHCYCQPKLTQIRRLITYWTLSYTVLTMHLLAMHHTCKHSLHIHLLQWHSGELT